MFKVGAPSGHDCAPPSIPIKISKLWTKLDSWCSQHMFLCLFWIGWTPQSPQTNLLLHFSSKRRHLRLAQTRSFCVQPCSIMKICRQPVQEMTTWTLHNFSRWFWICDSRESEEIHLHHHMLWWLHNVPSLSNRPSPWNLVGNRSTEPLHGLCTTFYADSECVSHSKVKKFIWTNIYMGHSISPPHVANNSRVPTWLEHDGNTEHVSQLCSSTVGTWKFSLVVACVQVLHVWTYGA